MTVSLTIDDRGVAQLNLARPDKHNALTGAMIADLTRHAQDIAANPNIRAVVLRGQGASFCAGGDLRWLVEQISGDASTRHAGIAALADMLWALNEIPQPVIGRVQGNAFGTGVALMSICDIVVGIETANFGITETKLGITPGALGPFIVARIGMANARRTFLSSHLFDAQAAQNMGLLSKVVSADDLDAAIAQEIAEMLSCAPQAAAATKAQLRSLAPQITRQIVDQSVTATIKDWDNPETANGIAAFFAKQSPPWVK